jgi:hypothetical protein
MGVDDQDTHTERRESGGEIHGGGRGTRLSSLTDYRERQTHSNNSCQNLPEKHSPRKPMSWRKYAGRAFDMQRESRRPARQELA